MCYAQRQGKAEEVNSAVCLLNSEEFSELSPLFDLKNKLPSLKISFLMRLKTNAGSRLEIIRQHLQAKTTDIKN